MAYIAELLGKGVLQGPVLELGAGYGGNICRTMIKGTGLDYFSTDISHSREVDFVADFEYESVRQAFDRDKKFATVLILNVLEHTFDPVRVMDNAVCLLSPAGRIVVIAPAVWSIHEFPHDCYRMLPQWFEKYAEKRGLNLPRELFRYVGIGPVDDFRDAAGRYCFPPPVPQNSKYLKAKIVHRVFNTFGRSMAFPSCLAVGAVFES